MTVLEAFNSTFDRYTRKLPGWANVLLWLWILVGALVYFGLVELIGWWRLVVMFPIALFVIAVLMQMVAYVVGWISAPARWLLNKRKASK